MNYEELLADVFRYVGDGKPDSIRVHPDLCATYVRIAEEGLRFQRIFTPAGLREIFPALH